MNTVSIVIRTRDEGRTIGEVLRRIGLQRRAADEVILVDSGSADRTPQIAEEYGARVISMDPAEFTYGRALNAGARESSTDLVAFVSGHALPFDRDWLGNFVSLFEDPEIAGVTGKSLPHPDCNPFDARGLLRRYGTDPAPIHLEGPVTFSNANSCVRRAVWEQLPFDEKLPYSEDLEWSLRAIRVGHRLLYSPYSAVYHSHNDNPPALFDRMYNQTRARTTLGIDPEDYRIWRLCWDAKAGTLYDLAAAMRSDRPLHWAKAAPLRRIALNRARYLASRGLDPNRRVLPSAIARSFYRALDLLTGILTPVAPALVRLTGKSTAALHPKHLTRSPDHRWYLEHIRPSDAILDVGCNKGAHAIAAAQKAKQVVGMDTDADALAQARSLAQTAEAGNLHWVLSDAEGPLPFPDSRFDVVMALDALEHVDRREALLSEMRRVLAPGGKILLSVPNSETSRKKRRRDLGLPYFSDPDHRIEFSREQIETLVSGAGLEVVEISPVVLDTSLYSIMDLLGALSLGLYRRLARYRRNAALKRPEESTGFRLVLNRRDAA